MRILLTGPTGQVGSVLLSSLNSLGRVIPMARSELDLAACEAIESTLDLVKPDLIVNPAAYTAVDQAEDEPDIAHRVNAEAPGIIARWASPRRVPFVHFSTDYVFDGSRERPWREEDRPRPLSIYGATKLAGEQLIRSARGSHLIIRTSWVYAAQGRNFLSTIVRLAKERQELNIVSDQVGAPTSARVVADTAAQVLAVSSPDLASSFAAAHGLLHLTASGKTSWHGFATAITRGLKERGVQLKVRAVHPISTRDYPTKARRPLNSRLALDKLERQFGIVTPPWEEALEPELDKLKD
jgi:dTDP-4-dehydrorhamnose reductase